MKILVPIDKTQGDRAVEEYILKLARRLKAKVTLLHVVPTVRGLLPGSLREARAYAEVVAGSLREQGLAVEGFAEKGDPAAMILQYAEDLEADMIAMATRGRNGWEKAILGSVAEHVVRQSAAPVLLVRLASHEQAYAPGRAGSEVA